MSLLFELAPISGLSILNPSVINSNLSYIKLAYYSMTRYTNAADILGFINSKPNTPADDYWTLFLEYGRVGDFVAQQIPISFLPTGEIDYGHTLQEDVDTANTLLTPTIILYELITGDASNDIWKFINFQIVSLYWLFLYDFGQIVPTIYSNYTATGFPVFTNPLSYSSRNNIFVNDTLFEIFSSYLHNSIIPVINKLGNRISPPEFLPLDSNNTLHQIDQSLYKSYPCLQRRLKGWAALIVTILAADYPLVIGGYSLVIWIASWWQKRKDKDGILFLSE